ncbi:uncharacterized protein TrAtP1_003687 [Trichoderma atroviride]|uniref:uncharacterized protein n=1 Tax=Hypocrea atroviridis TaxID=63577 RepID=UPI003329EB1C|nr:hypothetical protein TrAtP1_003687 [Trichoderma atroviride]
MGPITIADSDDESDSNGQVVAPSLVTAQAQTRSSEQGSLATASTDSALFQQIFNEQNAAACERALQLQLQQELEDAPHQSSAMTIPDVPFQRTTKGFYHSSLTSVTDPRSEIARSFPTIRSSEKTLERTQERTQSAVDPWEVPSSPGAPKSLEEQAKDHGGHVPDQSYGRGKSLLCVDTPLENRWDDLESMGGRDKKRRRLDQSEAALSQSNDVDLIMPPNESRLISTDNEQETAAASSTSLPAMPIDDTSSACQLKHSSPVERGPGNALSATSSAIPKYNNLLLKQQTQYAVGSSGSATNINTPRNEMFSIQSFGSKAPEEQESTTTTKKVEYRNFVSRRGSSPDIISAPAPDLDEVAPVPEYLPGLDSEPKIDQEYRDDRDPLADQPRPPDELPPEELPPEESDAEFVARPTPAVKSKKKRGRPKKSLETDEPPPVKPAESPTPATDAISPVPTTQKKKRGRPKKQSDEPPVESVLLAAATPTPNVSGEKKARGKKKATKGRKKLVVLSDSEGDHCATEDLTAEEAREQNVVEEALKAETTKDDQKRAASSKKSKTKASLDDQIIPDNKSEDENEPQEIKQHATREKEEKSGDKKGLSALGLAKPIYRVGLSKRSRIAPLLKSVRKT